MLHPPSWFVCNFWRAVTAPGEEIERGKAISVNGIWVLYWKVNVYKTEATASAYASLEERHGGQVHAESYQGDLAFVRRGLYRYLDRLCVPFRGLPPDIEESARVDPAADMASATIESVEVPTR
jgi:hypothetical protein